MDETMIADRLGSPLAYDVLLAADHSPLLLVNYGRELHLLESLSMMISGLHKVRNLRSPKPRNAQWM